ncbi:sugar phosphate isomerase/epimerase [Thalassoglobus sp. JC818]|uniref:sugar phosphate isomerase/epimerase family protein n=1 Tax=Thalassoglobus sp. JC818 TaxID=3232136 RepID=UPI003457900C
MLITRRKFCEISVAAASSLTAAVSLCAPKSQAFELNYIVASAMYGKNPLETILAELPQTGAKSIEIWAERHGNQREQIDEMGEDRFRELLDQHGVKLGSLTCFKYGIFNMQSEMQLTKRLGGDMVICNSGGKKDLSGDDLKREVKAFAEKLKPTVELAESLEISVGVENHSGGLISSPESIFMLLDEMPSSAIGLAMAPYHLPQDPSQIAEIIHRLGDRLVHFQAWEHGMGCTEKLPKEQEMLQLPHRGPLDFVPIVSALKETNFQGRTEVFMHPVPRGIPILPNLSDVTREIKAGHNYLEDCLAKS